ncbi:MAG: cytochrome C [Rhodobacterales bacterium RIFCSPHIGHO2_02_FULL_62_130]|jgi:cytochrome c|nr:MAG: cytochrome C [Rhodobacterales bacterium RIFCSPHIGHO2_02_FULL_62_130]OHC61030.1 MAG: cytochrome C [Rhodobacterales bacterium RIFCSPHIGHO2_12_FULL_62_75]HCY99121.1 cytochrome c family protein [Rhodobacter sp.]
MFDTMTLTKVTGAVCGSLLVYLFGAWAAETLYHTGAPAGHGGEEVAQAYTIETGEAAPTEAAEAGPVFGEVYAAADAAAGEKVFGKCKACHKVDGADGTGPHLNGVVNRARAGVAGFGYSDGMKSVTDPWTPDALNAFLENPKAAVPGTKMSFAGLAKVEDRANVIAYLATLP